MVVDADALNALAGQRSRFEGPRIFTPHPGEMSALDRQDHRRDSSGSHRHARAFRHRARRVSGAEREPQRDRVSGWPRVDQSHRVAGHGHRRHGRCAYRNDRGIGGAVSRSNWRTRCSPPSTCMGARANWAPRRSAKNLSWPPICSSSCPRRCVKSRTYHTESEEETIALGEKLAAELPPQPWCC